MKSTSLTRLSFNQLASHFIRIDNNDLLLQLGSAEGNLKMFKPDKGLRVTFWDCLFFNGMELYNPALPAEERNFFTLAYFLEPQNPDFIKSPGQLKKQMPWNSLFVSAASTFGIALRPMTRYRCISISFSRSWLLNVLKTNSALQRLKETFSQTEDLEWYHCMGPEERNALEDLCLSARQEHFRTFYVKALALQLVSDFLYRLTEEQPFVHKNSLQNTLEDVEQRIADFITKEFPGTKVLAQQFSVSESTLKRHFRKKFGMTISAFVTNQKMQYAKRLISEQGLSMAEASRMVGYRSVQNFKTVFCKYFKSLPLKHRGEKLPESFGVC